MLVEMRKISQSFLSRIRAAVLALPFCILRAIYEFIVTLIQRFAILLVMLAASFEHPLTRLNEQKKKATAGKNWFDLPRTELTPQLKRDLQLIKMRNVLDPHRHYKKDGGKMKPPEYSQVGTIMEGATEFYSCRIENKKRKRTFVEEVLAGEQETGRYKKKYLELQGRKTSGKKAFYQALKAKRKGGVKKGGQG